MLIAAPKFQVSMTLVAFAGDKSISSCLQIAAVLSVWSFANNYCIFIFAQLIFPSVQDLLFSKISYSGICLIPTSDIKMPHTELKCEFLGREFFWKKACT